MGPLAYKRASTDCFVFSNDEERTRALGLAEMRRKRLNKTPNDVFTAIFYDILLGAGPWIAGTCAVAVGLLAIHENVDGAPATFSKFDSPAAIGVISTFSAFLLVSKIQANLACNSTIITEFNNLTGSLVNLSLWVKSQVVSEKRAVQEVSLPDGSGGCYTTNKIGMTLASVPYAVKYAGRGVDIRPEGLPLGQDKKLVEKYREYTSKGNQGAEGSMTPFVALVLMIGEQIDQIQRGEQKDSEYAVLFAQLNAVTAAEGAIGATSGYNPPYIMDALLFVVFVLYLTLALVSDLIPNNGANSIWIAAIIALCTIVFFQISDRYWNPMALRSKRSGQEPLISKMCVSTELAILAVFARDNTNPLVAPLGEPTDAAGRAPSVAMPFLLRLGQ
jgi:hypothetical protein